MSLNDLSSKASSDSVAYVSDFDMEIKESGGERDSQVSREEVYAYTYETLADEEWLKCYQREEEENKKLEQALQGRLDVIVQVDTF